MIKMKLLAAASAAALLLAGNANAQSPQMEKSAPPAMQKNDAAPAQTQAPAQRAPGTADKGSAMDKAAPTEKGASTMDKNAPARAGAEQKSDSKMSTDSKSGADTKAAGSAGTKAGATTGAAPSSGNLTAEQKTKIQQTVLTSSAPRVTNVNFNISVGTVVPTSVSVVAVPPALIEIHPEWRGYRYFVVRTNEIVIVEPGSMKIVAVLVI